MFESAYQGGPAFEIFSTQGSNPVALWKVTAGIQKVLDKTVKGYVYSIDGTQSRMQLPKDEKKGLGLVQPHLIFQIYLPVGRPLTLEVGVSDSGKTRRRLLFSSAFKETVSTPLHARIPIHVIRRGTWLNLALDMVSLVSQNFRGNTYRSVDFIAVGGVCKLRRIFSMRDAPLDTSDDDMIYGLERLHSHFEPIPRAHEFPVGVNSITQTFTMEKVRRAESGSQESQEDEIIDETEQHNNGQQWRDAPSSPTRRGPSSAKPKTTAPSSSSSSTAAAAAAAGSKTDAPHIAFGRKYAAGTTPVAKTPTATNGKRIPGAKPGSEIGEVSEHPRPVRAFGSAGVRSNRLNGETSPRRANAVSAPTNRVFTAQQNSANGDRRNVRSTASRHGGSEYGLTPRSPFGSSSGTHLAAERDTPGVYDHHPDRIEEDIVVEDIVDGEKDKDKMKEKERDSVARKPYVNDLKGRDREADRYRDSLRESQKENRVSTRGSHLRISSANMRYSQDSQASPSSIKKDLELRRRRLKEMEDSFAREFDEDPKVGSSIRRSELKGSAAMAHHQDTHRSLYSDREDDMWETNEPQYADDVVQYGDMEQDGPQDEDEVEQEEIEEVLDAESSPLSTQLIESPTSPNAWGRRKYSSAIYAAEVQSMQRSFSDEIRSEQPFSEPFSDMSHNHHHHHNNSNNSHIYVPPHPLLSPQRDPTSAYATNIASPLSRLNLTKDLTSFKRRPFTPPVVPVNTNTTSARNGQVMSSVRMSRSMLKPFVREGLTSTMGSTQLVNVGSPNSSFRGSISVDESVNDIRHSMDGQGQSGDLEVMYDPDLNCYFDPKTNTYYELRT
eukprot:GILJ01003861.1.p1 GENE.GILJ01003861.1~~GILJ01003861.1.p1  ORF type:complete len:847 (+),score=73.44 GILJ01003861.1:39-2543(+)